MPRFDYARLDPEICAKQADTVIFTAGQLALRLRASVPVDVSKGAALAEFDLAAESPPPSSWRMHHTARTLSPPIQGMIDKWPGCPAEECDRIA